jgi:hypothetical protein
MASKFFKNIFGIGKPKKPKGFKTPKPRPKPKVKPKPKPKPQAGAQSKKGGSTRQIKGFKDLTRGEKVALGVGAAGSGALTGLKLKQGKDAGAKESAQPPKKGPASKPKKKPNLGTKSVQSGPKKKKKLANLDDKFIKTKKSGFLKDKTGKRVTRLTKEELMKRRKAQR